MRKARTAAQRIARDSGTTVRGTGLTHRASTRPVRPPAKVEAQLALVEQAVGGRDALIAGLLHAPKARELSYLFGLIGDPLRAGTSLAELCAIGGITPGELVAAYAAGEINRGQAIANSKVGQRLGAVAEDTMRHALPHQIRCLECAGSGSVVDDRGMAALCQTCKGQGTHEAEGDIEHKKLALEMGKMLQKGGGVNVNVQQHTATFVGSAGGALEKLQEATDRVLFGGQGGDIVDGEAVEAEDCSADTEGVEEEEAVLDTDWQGHPL